VLKTTRVIAAATLLAIFAAAPFAHAQGTPQKKEEVIRMPSPRKSDDPPALWAYFTIFIILAAVGIANVIPSKRGHQD
jgi:hypothetical protein